MRYRSQTIEAQIESHAIRFTREPVQLLQVVVTSPMLWTATQFIALPLGEGYG
jgi:hypothetical protein